MINKRLFIYGAGGHGRVVADVAQCAGWSDITFFDDNAGIRKTGAWPVAGDWIAMIDSLDVNIDVVVAIGNNEIRCKRTDQLIDEKVSLATLIHPAAVVCKDVDLGDGSVIMPGAVINTGAKLDKSVIVNTNATIEHDCLIGQSVHICPGVNVAGGVSIGDRSWIGIGASLIQNICIGENVVVGAGSVVLDNVGDNLKVAGVPAHDIGRNEQ